MVSHHPAKFCGRNHCGTRDIILLVIKEQDSIRFHLIPPLLFISRTHDLKVHDILH